MTASSLFLLPVLALSTATPQLQPVPAHDRATTAFATAVHGYVELHRTLEPHIAAFTSDPEQIARSRSMHREAIRRARATARRGDVFTPIVSAYFRRQLESVTPDAVLAVLPVLPEELVYKVQGRDLVLLDVELDLIVDVLAGALPPEQLYDVEPGDSESCAPDPLPALPGDPCDAHPELDMCWS
jgi:hypothetical protein